MKKVQEYFGIIEDPRHSGYVTHKLEDVLTIVMCGVLCGLDKLDDIVAYQESNQENLTKEFGIDALDAGCNFLRRSVPFFN